jgi:ketosteroid isomerase-like protein
MSKENVELYRRGIEAFNRRDLEAFLALAHPDVVGISRVLAIEGGSYRGHDGTREWWKELLDVFPGRVRVAGL